MHILHIVKASGVAGYENHLRDLLPALQTLGYTIELALLHPPQTPLTDFAAQFQQQQITVHQLPIAQHFSLAVVKALVALLRQSQPTLVHTHGLHADLHGTLAAKRTGIPLVQSRHNDDPFRRKFPINQLNTWLGGYASAVIAISHYLNRFVTEVERIPANKVTTIHYGLDPTPPNAPLAPDANGLTIGFVGRLIEQKGVEYLLQALATLKDTLAFQVMIVGDGNRRAALEALSASLALTDRVQFLGWQANAAAQMRAMDIVVVPSRWEGFGLVALEAMAARKPVIASRVSALPEIIVDGQTGYLIEPGNVTQLAAALETLATAPQKRQQLGNAGYARLTAAFSVAKMAQATAAVYTDVKR